MTDINTIPAPAIAQELVHFKEPMIAVLRLVALQRASIVYGDLAKAIGWMGPMIGPYNALLYAVSRDCAEKGIPNLTSLAVKAQTGEPGAGLRKAGVTDWAAEQGACFAWAASLYDSEA